MSEVIGNGDAKLITKNIYLVLRQLRDKTSNGTFWIDALCINQEDNVEKGQQVH